jgi:tetratricopeptide (TPR) repeat protein
MCEQDNPHEIYRKVLSQQTFEALAEMEAPEKWGELAVKEREALAMLFVWRGERELVAGKGGVKESFDLSELVAPESAVPRHWQGIAWLKAGVRSGAAEQLEWACEKFADAVGCDAGYGEAWHGWAVALCRLGVMESDSTWFEEADEKFKRASECELEGEGPARVYRDWGRCWQQSGMFSEEAHDYRQAVAKYERAKELGCNEATFWLDYGQTVGLLAQLVGDVRLLDEALGAYGRAVQVAEHDPAGWILYGRTLRRFFQVTGDASYLKKAENCFEKAGAIDEGIAELWLEWGELLLTAGHASGNERDLEEALLKLRRAEELSEGSLEVTSLLIRALTELGLEGDGRLDLLKEAEARAKAGVDLDPGNATLWCRQGDAAMALAIYFSEMDDLDRAFGYYNQALELDADHLEARMGLASACYSLGLLERDFAQFERCTKHCEQILASDESAVDAWNEWGMALFKMAELTGRADFAQDSLAKFDRAIALRGGWEGTPNEEWVFNYAACADFLGTLIDDEECHHQAVKVLGRLLQRSPDDRGVRFQLALAWIHLGEVVFDPECYDHAIEHLRLLTTEDPDDEIIWDEWGCALIALAQMIDDPGHRMEVETLRGEAEQNLIRAAGLGSNEAYYHLAWLYTHLGHYEAATLSLRRSAERGSLPPVDDLLRDDWLKELRDTKGFRTFLNELGQ